MSGRCLGKNKAKRLSAAKRANKDKSSIHEVNPGASATGAWTVYCSAPLGTLTVNADQLDVTENGTLIFIIGGSNGPPHVVIGGDQYLYCTKVC
jgi:hypothetical protein